MLQPRPLDVSDYPPAKVTTDDRSSDRSIGSIERRALLWISGEFVHSPGVSIASGDFLRLFLAAFRAWAWDLTAWARVHFVPQYY